MTALNAANLLDTFFRSPTKEHFDPRSILLAAIEIESHVKLWASTGTNVTAFEDALPLWRSEIYHFIVPDSGMFGSYSGSGNLSAGDIGVLSWAAERIAASASESTETSRDGVRDMVQHVRSLLVEDRTLPDRLRLHVTRLLHHVEDALESFEITGDFLLEDAVERLLGAIQLVEQTSSDPSKWQKFRDSFIPPFATQLAASGTLQGMAAITANITGLP